MDESTCHLPNEGRENVFYSPGSGEMVRVTDGPAQTSITLKEAVPGVSLAHRSGEIRDILADRLAQLPRNPSGDLVITPEEAATLYALREDMWNSAGEANVHLFDVGVPSEDVTQVLSTGGIDEMTRFAETKAERVICECGQSNPAFLGTLEAIIPRPVEHYRQACPAPALS